MKEGPGGSLSPPARKGRPLKKYKEEKESNLGDKDEHEGGHGDGGDPDGGPDWRREGSPPLLGLGLTGVSQ